MSMNDSFFNDEFFNVPFKDLFNKIERNDKFLNDFF